MLTASVAADAVTFVAVNLSTMVRTPVGDVTCVVCELSAYFASSSAFATTVILGTPALALLRVCLVHRIANAIRRRSARSALAGDRRPAAGPQRARCPLP